jgi:hypothetical protein
MHLKGSCHCGAVKFSLHSDSPVPYMHCYCSICRKTAGSGGYAVNVGGDADSMKVRGSQNVSRFHALIREPGRRARRSPAWRHFCRKCGSPLWLSDPRWPHLVHPHASAIDTPLPRPPEVVEASLASAPAWVDVPSGKGHVHCDGWPEESLREWHERHGMPASEETSSPSRKRRRATGKS